jgi:hypothetical protein
VSCGRTSGDRLFSEKVSPRLFAVIQRNHEDPLKRFDVVISMNDSSGVKKVVPAVNIPTRSVATGRLTAAEIHTLAELSQVIRIDVSKTFYPNASQ